MLPVLSFSQTSHYDSLYQQGLISKEDYELLKPKIDSNAARVAHYDSLYKNRQISKEDYDRLRISALVKRDAQLKKSPVSLMTRGKNQIGWGGALLGGSGLFFIVSGVASIRSSKAATGTAVVGAAMFCAGLPLLIHGLVLRHHAKTLMQ